MDDTDSRPQAGPRHAKRRRVSRRAVLGSAVLITAGAGAGVVAGIVSPIGEAADPLPPPELSGAAARERALIAALDAALATQPSHPVLLAVRADHRQHLEALEFALEPYRAPAEVTVTVTAPPPRGGAPTLLAAEQAAATAAATESAALTGWAATLLASIAACEAAHAELLA